MHKNAQYDNQKNNNKNAHKYEKFGPLESLPHYHNSMSASKVAT